MPIVADGPVLLRADPTPDSGDAVERGLTALDISKLSIGEVVDRLTPVRRDPAMELVDWLLSSQQRAASGSIVEELCTRMLAAGLPLDRYGSSTSMVTADHDAIGRVWSRDEGVQETVYVRAEENDPEYLASPFAATAESGEWLDLWIPDTAAERFGIIASLRASKIVHYICIPVWLTNKANGWITFATKRVTGFSEQDLLTIALIVPVVTARIDARVGWTTLDKLLRTYVGDEPHTAILAGRAKRGQVSTITAAMLVADLRDSTGHTADLTAVQAVHLFNDLFDCLVPPVESLRGEVLKYLGDGLLAIFRESGGDHWDAADRALQAAEGAFGFIASWNATHPTHRPMQIGIALHYGEIAYGNIGSGSRLDFTVIGRDVGLATRIAGINARLGQPLLLSAPFVSHLRSPVERIGVFPARGFRDPVEVFRPLGADASAARTPPR